MTKVHYQCDMLIDQNLIIANTPMGHKCCSVAEFEIVSSGFLVCQECMKISQTAPERLSFPCIGGKEHQDKLLEDLFKKPLLPDFLTWK